MDGPLIVLAILVTAIGALFFRGNRILRLREETWKKLEAQSGKKVDVLGVVDYHGGFPQIPKPQKLTVALTDDEIVLRTRKGQEEVLSYGLWKKIEKFTTLTKQDPKKKSLVLWGPLSNLLFADRRRHFIVVKYQDRNDQDNNLLTEYGTPDQMNASFEKMNDGWNQYRRRASTP